MKVLKRNYGHRNLILFLVLSLVYLQAIHSLSIGRTIFSLLSLRSFLTGHYLILALTAFAGGMIIKIKKYSELILLICLVAMVGENFILLSASFNKLTLVLNFIYLVFAFYFFITWELEVGLASFNPKFSTNDLEKESRFKLQASIRSSRNDAGGVNARITNIDEDSCFLLFDKNSIFEPTPSGKYFLESFYEGVCFQHYASLVSSYDRGIGLVFEDSPDARVSWSELYKVCLDRGIVGQGLN